ncbi:MAG: hypothetical protein LUC49_01360 [Prevotella sp.]|nr:hypothetical protein [Prevotella sp.]MCD8305300.1 hypothetical protein [Prevotella sp.]
MKKIIFALLLSCTFAAQAPAQAIYEEVKNIMDEYQAVKDDTSKSLDVRKVATFKWDAIYYMVSKGGNMSESELGQQVSAMIDFVNLFIDKIDKTKNAKNRQVVMSKFKNATLENARYNDTDKEVIYAYVDNQNFLTQFSLDTDWVKALEEVSK